MGWTIVFGGLLIGRAQLSFTPFLPSRFLPSLHTSAPLNDFSGRIEQKLDQRTSQVRSRLIEDGILDLEGHGRRVFVESLT